MYDWPQEPRPSWLPSREVTAMQETLVDQIQVYDGWFHEHWEIGAMWVVTGYQGEEPVTERWSTGFPSDFQFPTTEWVSRRGSDYFEMTFRASVSKRAAFGHMGGNRREAMVTEVLRCCPIPNSYYGRHDPSYVGPAVALANRLWRAERSSPSEALRTLVGGVEELIRRVEAEAAPYAISRPLKRLLNRLGEGSISGPPVGLEADRLRSQALVVLHWLARSSSDLSAFAAAVESYFAVPGYAEEALGWVQSAVEGVTPSLIDALHHPDPQTRRRCAEALGSGRPGNGTAVQELAAVFKDSDPHVREAGAGSLGRIGAAAEVATRALIEALGDEEANVRWASWWALWRILPAAQHAITPLIRVLGRAGRNRREGESKPSDGEGPTDPFGDRERPATLRDVSQSTSRPEESERRARCLLAEWDEREAAVGLL